MSKEQFITEDNKKDSLIFVKELMINEVYYLCDLLKINKENFDFDGWHIPEGIDRSSSNPDARKYVSISRLCESIKIINEKLEQEND